MSYTVSGPNDVESVIDDEYGGMWFLRDALDADRVGVTIMELEPGAKGKRHDHADDGQEEVYVVVEGTVEVELDGDSVTLSRNQAIRLSPEQPRQIHSRGEETARLVLVGGPGA
jgi:mannose-6-phosphate isomerase-like protein (cupin superfamily)